MSNFDPRSKNRKYLTRSTFGQMEFTSADDKDCFSHHEIFSNGRAHEGRLTECIIHGRTNIAFRNEYLSREGIRDFDEPYDYYRDSRKLD